MSCVETRTTTVLRDGDMRALNDLDQVYGHAYDLAVTRCHWVAYGLRTSHWLVAPCAAELRRLIVADAAVHSCVV
jgi:hypothetical protein